MYQTQIPYKYYLGHPAALASDSLISEHDIASPSHDLFEKLMLI